MFRSSRCGVVLPLSGCCADGFCADVVPDHASELDGMEGCAVPECAGAGPRRGPQVHNGEPWQRDRPDLR